VVNIQAGKRLRTFRVDAVLWRRTVDNARPFGGGFFPARNMGEGRCAGNGLVVAEARTGRQFFESLPRSSVVVVDRGKVVIEWGDPGKRIKGSSVRKSLLSALYGNYVRNGRIQLDRTLEQLGIDDDPPLTREEKQATLRMVLQSRSGVYHTFVAGTPEMSDDARSWVPSAGYVLVLQQLGFQCPWYGVRTAATQENW
jgi:CubicO group peptidase (beta-lactamase class C family)